jgi:hypothetical protein
MDAPLGPNHIILGLLDDSGVKGPGAHTVADEEAQIAEGTDKTRAARGMTIDQIHRLLIKNTLRPFITGLLQAVADEPFGILAVETPQKKPHWQSLPEFRDRAHRFFEFLLAGQNKGQKKFPLQAEIKQYPQLLKSIGVTAEELALIDDDQALYLFLA